MSQDGTVNKFGNLVVPIPTAESAQAAVNAALDSADEADMREILNTQGDLHEAGSNEANAEATRAAAKTADEAAVDKAVADLEAELESNLDKLTDAILASPAVNDMIEAALADEELDKAPVTSLVAARVTKLEQKVAAFEILLNEFKERALKAFKSAGFKF